MRNKVYKVVVFVFLVLNSVASSDKVDPDVFRNITEIITSKGYPCEDYTVTTADGFILSLQRIPHGVKGHPEKQQRPVVYLQHGLLCDSTTWVTNIIQDSLGFLLADTGFDVWLGNSRGNTYSRRHVKLSPDQPQFWDWRYRSSLKESNLYIKGTQGNLKMSLYEQLPFIYSWDEMAKYDIPVVIDFILNKTKEEQLYYIGHSQGTLIGFSAFSQNQEIGKKVKKFFALAPVAFLGHTESAIKLFSNWPEWLYFDVFGRRDFLPSDWFFKLLAVTACKDKWTAPICLNTLFVICGYDYKNLNQSRLPVYVGHTPAGTSVKNMIHYSQAISTGKYQMYDYGAEGNKQHYGQNTPPQYNVGNMKTPIHLYSSTNDWLADPKDVLYLLSQLKTQYNSTEIPTWNHLDFTWGIDANKILYKQIIQTMLNSEHRHNN